MFFLEFHSAESLGSFTSVLCMMDIYHIWLTDACFSCQAIFQRHRQPEKKYQSFSLIYDDRSLDLVSFLLLSYIDQASWLLSILCNVYEVQFVISFWKHIQICKDKEEAEVWFTGLKALIERNGSRFQRNDSRKETAASGSLSGRRVPSSSSVSFNISFHLTIPE